MNRQVHHEASSIFYDENLFIALGTCNTVVPRLFSKVGLRPVLDTREAEFKRIKKVAMHLTITQEESSSSDYFGCIFACDDLHLLCRGLLSIGSDEGHGLTFLRRSTIGVCICDPSVADIYGFRFSTAFGPSDLRRLLEPFTALHNIEHCRITGPVTTEYQSYILQQIARPAPNLESAITHISALKDEGNVAYRSHQDIFAIARYEAALMHLLTSFWDQSTSQTGEFANITTSDASDILSSQLHSNLAAALLRTRRFADCYYWAFKGLTLVTRGNNEHSWREIFKLFPKLAFRRALATKGMGDTERAAEEMRFAMGLEPGNATIKRELMALEREAEEKRQRHLEEFWDELEIARLRQHQIRGI